MRLSEREYQDLCKRNGIKYIPANEKNNKRRSSKNKDFDSLAEENFYCYYIRPRIATGQIQRCEIHKSFIIIEADPKHNLKAKKFTPDFILYDKGGDVRVIEMKGSVVKRLQRDYQLRKHLFIEKYCVPNQWEYREEKSENWT